MALPEREPMARLGQEARALLEVAHQPRPELGYPPRLSARYRLSPARQPRFQTPRWLQSALQRRPRIPHRIHAVSVVCDVSGDRSILVLPLHHQLHSQACSPPGVAPNRERLIRVPGPWLVALRTSAYPLLARLIAHPQRQVLLWAADPIEHHPARCDACDRCDQPVRCALDAVNVPGARRFQVVVQPAPTRQGVQHDPHGPVAGRAPCAQRHRLVQRHLRSARRDHCAHRDQPADPDRAGRVRADRAPRAMRCCHPLLGAMPLPMDWLYLQGQLGWSTSLARHGPHWQAFGGTNPEPSQGILRPRRRGSQG